MYLQRAGRLAKKRQKIFGMPAPKRVYPPTRRRIRMEVALINAREKTPGQHRGPITRKTEAILIAIVERMNRTTGYCYPTWATIARDAGCSRSSVVRAMKVLERYGLIEWINRLKWDHVIEETLVGQELGRRPVRTSNAYELGSAFLQDSEPDEIGRTENDTLTSQEYILITGLINRRVRVSAMPTRECDTAADSQRPVPSPHLLRKAADFYPAGLPIEDEEFRRASQERVRAKIQEERKRNAERRAGHRRQ